MQKKIAAFLFSTRLTSFLFIAFAVAMAVGTFLDASSETSPTPYSRELIYNAWWFELIMVLFVVNFIGNIFRFRLYKKEKWATLTLHLSFILILVGAGVTRYLGYEGVMHIREGATENTFLSEHTYLKTFIDGDYEVDGVLQRRNLPPKKLNLSERLDNEFVIETDYNQQPLSIRYNNFIKNAKQGLIISEGGERYLKIVEAGDGNRHDHWLKVGEVANIHNILFAVNTPTEGAVNITVDEASNAYTIEAPFEGTYMRMADQARGTVEKDSVQPLMLRSLYQMAGMAFVIPEPMAEGRQGVMKAGANEKTNQDALIVDVSSGGETQTVELLGGKGTNPNPQAVEVGGLTVYLSFGSEAYELPFSITLNDFIADKYPGTETGYSAFKSKVTVNDSEDTFFDYEIFMNHVLDHKGYRFFQASFDPDEKGTVLSVNHDWWGTWITYIGYFLLYLGLMAILFDRNTRFGSLKKMLNKVKAKKAGLTLILLFLSLTMGTAQEHTGNHTQALSSAQIDSIITANTVDKEHAARFGMLVLQDNGRMKPVNTFASELLRKVSRRNTYNELDANQVFLSMSEFPRVWFETPLIAVKWQNDSIRRVLGVAEGVSRIRLIDLIDDQGRNKLDPYLEAATTTNTPNQFQKDIVKVYENAYLLNQALSGGILKIFPKPDDPNNKWVSYPELGEANFKGMDSVATRAILPAYFSVLKEARNTGDYSQADEILEGMKRFQEKYGSEVMPSDRKVQAEILYNEVNLFNRLYHYFAMMGVFMFLFIIARIFREGKVLRFLIAFCKYTIWLFFILMTLGLIFRWYISGHAPWSDAYESIIYVAWATVFFGLAFGRKSNLTIASTAFVAAIILWVANQNWLDPSIANLQPVLDSYWLMIHVAVIVASYGPFTLGMILGATSLLLMLLTTRKNKVKMELNIKELTIITEMALTVGLVMLTIGNFLGGQWANESWGRYWGWDPKETWALISIMVYAFVIHMRLVPGLRGRWFFNVMAIFSFAAIMMTYFGVNFYLTGLHSYASGDVPVTPSFVYYILVFFVTLSGLSYWRYRKHYSPKNIKKASE
ncbi:cytochrome c biogenesis protein CcsA [Altibacter sp. HG106]|uniref:cytochrome c biogenesis protein CcsA n=1 Tax=Altibacter sp. HG106 TaxID=3023937 RepID=UPI0023500B0F|nr:cytochrome c biogenesis protein CcsA [Altibacter sp. HG106]MDC7993692.1 cytochrome c biogenesis protein CcsA [Altibacter sp. HG106]